MVPWKRTLPLYHIRQQIRIRSVELAPSPTSVRTNEQLKVSIYLVDRIQGTVSIAIVEMEALVPAEVRGSRKLAVHVSVRSKRTRRHGTITTDSMELFRVQVRRSCYVVACSHRLSRIFGPINCGRSDTESIKIYAGCVSDAIAILLHLGD